MPEYTEMFILFLPLPRPLPLLVTYAEHRSSLDQPIGDRRLAGIGEGCTALAQALAATGKDGLAPVVVRAAIAERPVARLGIPHDRIAASAIVGGVQAVLEGDLGDDLRPPVVGMWLLERAGIRETRGEQHGY